VDVVIVMSNYEDHFHHTTLALKHNKYAMVEKPLAMSLQDADAILAAEQNSTGKVFVGYIRRYSPAFLTLDEIGGMDSIQYVQIRGSMPSIYTCSSF
jgi:predicted dehydrogenase